MNRILPLFLICMFLLSCSTNDDKDVVRSYWENGNLKSELRYKDGKLNGDCCWYFSNGKPDMKDPHFDRTSQIILGERYAVKILEMCYGMK